MGCQSSKSQLIPREEPGSSRPGHLHSRRVQKPPRPSSRSCPPEKMRPRLPRLRVPLGVEPRDGIDWAMALKPECSQEDSPTWRLAQLSPISTDLAWRRNIDPDGSQGMEDAEVRNIDRGVRTLQRTGTTLGRSEFPCIWNEDTIKNMSSGEVIIEARRRVRKYYKKRYKALVKHIDDLDARQGKPTTNMPLHQAQEYHKKKREAERLRESIEDGLRTQKDEAMRRVMPLLVSRWRE